MLVFNYNGTTYTIDSVWSDEIGESDYLQWEFHREDGAEIDVDEECLVNDYIYAEMHTELLYELNDSLADSADYNCNCMISQTDSELLK